MSVDDEKHPADEQAPEDEKKPEGEAAEGAQGSEGDDAEEKEKKTPLGKAEKSFAAINILVLLGVLGFVVWKFVLYEREKILESQNRQELADQAAQREQDKTSINLGEVTLNVKSERSGFRYLQLQIELETTLATADFIERKKALILDKIVEIGTSKKFDELKTVQGKLLFKDQLKREIDIILGDRNVIAVNFSTYLLQ